MRVRELALGTGPSGLGLKNNKTMRLVEVLSLFGNMDFIGEEWERELALGTGPSGLGLKNNKTMQLVEVLNLFGNMDFIVEEWPLKQVRQAWGQKIIQQCNLLRC